ncbi:MAG TPA: hypothetical protein ENN21_08840 [Spirochaetes bacterium]|nr:hypothetical protein [Spirochaetota bacterium]
MKSEMIAMPVYQDRISPLMDVSDRFAIFDVDEDVVRQKLVIKIQAASESERLEKLREMGITTIIGGAVSEQMARVAVDKGLRLISWINGPVDEIVELYLNGMLPPRCGCPRGPGRRRKARGGRFNDMMSNTENRSPGNENSDHRGEK